MAAPLVGRGHRRGLAHRRMLDARGLHLERPDPVTGRDDHVVGAAGVPVVTVCILLGRVLGVEPVAAEGLLRLLGAVPVAERVMRVGPRAQTDLAPLALRDRPLVLVQDLHVPAGHGPSHRALAHLHEGVVRDQWIRLRQAVEVEHGDPVLVAEPADRLRVQRLTGGADDPEVLRVPAAGVGDAHHRPHRGGSREHVRRPVLRQHGELLLGVEASFPLEDELRRTKAPRPDQRRDARGPGPLPHAVEQLAVVEIVAVDELLVPEDVAMRVQDALCQAGRAGGVIELGGVIRRGVDGLEVRRRAASRSSSSTITCSTRSRSTRSALSALVTSTFAWESVMRCRIPSSP